MEEDNDDNQLSLAIEASMASHQDQVQIQHLRKSQESLETNIAIHESIDSNKRRLQNQEMNAYATNYKIKRSEVRHEGSWDCQHCTFINRPYAPKCSMCNTKAPMHVLIFEPLPFIRFGLEIEIVIPSGRSDGFTLESIASNLTKLGPEKVEFLGYTHATSDSWKIVTDSSIEASNDDLCFELVSPILKGDGEEGLGQLRNIMDNVKRIGIATNASCGFHVHVDAEAGSILASLDAQKSVSQCFVATENAFDLIVATSRRGTNSNRYCQSNRIAFGSMSNRQRWNEIESATSRGQLVRMMNPNYDRYRKLNLTNLTKNNRPSTLEFRQHQGVQNLREAEVWVRLILTFCRNAMTQKQKYICMLSEKSTVKNELRALFELVGDQGIEQVFTVDRKLFEDNSAAMRNEWICKTCYREFGNSRSLSQHCLAIGHNM
mmetsp:Transcript_6989/g.7967  ORF Transcript_6989/g.7967 Transcript_6989/m.7967 type:complete len:433 (+) Transcript_6989:202-1500(+)